ncbi:MAG: hypothetical protein ACK40O_02665 [Allosphingosinicella sp.]
MPVSAVSNETVVRLERLLHAVQRYLPASAHRAVDRSCLCRAAIDDLLARYEQAPDALAERLGYGARTVVIPDAPTEG